MESGYGDVEVAAYRDGLVEVVFANGDVIRLDPAALGVTGQLTVGVAEGGAAVLIGTRGGRARARLDGRARGRRSGVRPALARARRRGGATDRSPPARAAREPRHEPEGRRRARRHVLTAAREARAGRDRHADLDPAQPAARAWRRLRRHRRRRTRPRSRPRSSAAERSEPGCPPTSSNGSSPRSTRATWRTCSHAV